MSQNQASREAGNQQPDLPRTNSLRSFQTQSTSNLPRRPRNGNAQQNQSSRAGPQSTSRNVPQRNTPRRPQPFSLAGGRAPPTHGVSYVDPNYREYNPNYRKEQNTPLWGLAKPLPRVVRPGMRRGRGGEEQGTIEDVEAEIEEPGSSEAIPQVGMVNDQRDNAGKEPVANKERRQSERGYGHQRERRAHTQSSNGRAGSQNSVVDTYTSSLHEKGDPMDDLSPRQVARQNSDPFEDQHGDLGGGWMSRLSSGEEMPSQPVSATSTSPAGLPSEVLDSNDTDLEAGEKYDEWPVEDNKAEQYMEEEKDMHNSWAEIRAKFREPLAECLATMVAVLIGLCTNLAVQTSNDKSGSYQSTNWAWGLGVTIGIYIAGGISGAHINPAISLMLCLYRGFPFRKALIYIAAQIFGAFLAGLIAYGVYKDAISAFDAMGGSIAADGGSTAAIGLSAGGSGKSFFTQPAPFAGAGTGFFNEFIATAILACALLALGDDSNAPPGAGMHALIVGLLVTVLSMAFGYNTAACLNPARDLGPRIATALVGYGGQVFTVNNAWWIYGAWGATITGALVGGLFYDVAIFVGGESPVNYPRGKRRKVKRKAKEEARRGWWGLRRGMGKEG